MIPDHAFVFVSHAVGSSLLATRAGFALVSHHRMEHDFVRQLRSVVRIALAPIVRYCIGKDVAGAVKVGRTDCTSDLWVAFESVLGVFVPEVKCTIATSGTECSVLGME